MAEGGCRGSSSRGRLRCAPTRTRPTASPAPRRRARAPYAGGAASRGSGAPRALPRRGSRTSPRDGAREKGPSDATTCEARATRRHNPRRDAHKQPGTRARRTQGDVTPPRGHACERPASNPSARRSTPPADACAHPSSDRRGAPTVPSPRVGAGKLGRGAPTVLLSLRAGAGEIDRWSGWDRTLRPARGRRACACGATRATP